jgi:hypothetical protein
MPAATKARPIIQILPAPSTPDETDPILVMRLEMSPLRIELANCAQEKTKQVKRTNFLLRNSTVSWTTGISGNERPNVSGLCVARPREGNT